MPKNISIFRPRGHVAPATLRNREKNVCVVYRVAICPLKRPNQQNLTFYNLFAWNEMVWPFWTFLNFQENSIFLGLF